MANQKDIIKEWTYQLIENNDFNAKLKKVNVNIFNDKHKDIFYLFVAFKNIIDGKSWNCDYSLFIPIGNDIYEYTFQANFEQIEQLQKKAFKKKDKCFSTTPFPPTINKDYNNQQLMDKYDKIDEMQRYMILNNEHIEYSPNNDTIYRCYGPAKHWWSSSNILTNNKQNDIDALCFTLNRLFNSPLFALENDLYSKLNIKNEIKNIIQDLANKQISSFKKEIRSSRCTDYTELYDIKNKNKTFNKIFAVSQPGNAIAHWALIFEGADTSIKFDYYNDSRVHIQILNHYIKQQDNYRNDDDMKYNICKVNLKAQKICWYSWPIPRPKSHFMSLISGKNEVQFTKRYEILSAICLNRNITANDVGDLICTWKKATNKYGLIGGQYNAHDQNCQHLVRDIISTFSKTKARQLTGKFDKIIVEGTLSVALVSGELDKEYKRLNEMHNVLWNKLEKSKNFRATNSRNLKKLLKDYKLLKYRKQMIDAGFYDANYHLIASSDLFEMKMNDNEISCFINNIHQTLSPILEFLIKINLKNKYEIFYMQGFDHIDDIDILKYCVSEKELKEDIGMMIGHYKRIVCYNNLMISRRNIIEKTREYLFVACGYVQVIADICISYCFSKRWFVFKNDKFNLSLFLNQWGLGEYDEMFKKVGFDDHFTVLKSLNKNELQTIFNMKFGHVKRFQYRLEMWGRMWTSAQKRIQIL